MGDNRVWIHPDRVYPFLQIEGRQTIDYLQPVCPSNHRYNVTYKSAVIMILRPYNGKLMEMTVSGEAETPW
jgi:hypothetical protein